jgi:hypothetical protein
MIGDWVLLDGARFYVVHLKCKQGLIHAALKINSDRFHVPQHDSDSIMRDAEWSDEPVLTCFTCISHVWHNTSARDRFDDVDEGDDDDAPDPADDEAPDEDAPDPDPEPTPEEPDPNDEAPDDEAPDPEPEDDLTEEEIDAFNEAMDKD